MNCKLICIPFILLAACFSVNAQIGDTAAPGSSFLATASVGIDSTIGITNLPVCTPANYACNTPASLNYIFIGAGNWDVPENWTNSLIPPATLNQNYQIIIDPKGTSDCILNVRQIISTGAKLTVLPGKKLKVLKGELIKN